MPMASAYQPILDENEWLARQLEGGKQDPAAALQKTFAAAREAARKRRCSAGKDQLLAGLAAAKDPATLPDALAAAKSVGDCFRQRSAEQRRDFWRKMEAPLEQTYGFAGKSEARLSLGYLYWAVDDFANSKKIFGEVMAAAAAAKAAEIESKALYALGRIAENEGDLAAATRYYEDYVARYPGKENFENALMAAVLLHIDKLEWDAAMTPLTALIQAQDALPIDERSVGTLSFALFWAGRVHLEQGRREQAAEMWRRVASEYYSTYYGAIGHYMLEQATGRKLALQPSRTPPFKMAKLAEAFDARGRERIQRIELLLRLGLRSDGICELEELGGDEKKPETVLVRALMYHAAGEWLNAIKAYDAVPRGFRGGIAVGFERLLFPRRYVDMIHTYAAKAGVDPDFVMAIIRQESVFNPQARSPVGAMGLMQLMPKTAVIEAKRLGSGYLAAKERSQLRQKVRVAKNLLTPETNLAIGIHHVRSLLGKYQSPVFVLSAYNASPSAAQRWQESIPTRDVLAFIERIPYRETRAYVKLVLRNYFYYKRWYDSPMQKLDHLDAVTSPLVAMVRPAEVPPTLPAAAAAAPAEGAVDGATPNH
jgi:soluble lytic murein transglycosylase-like protein